MDLRACRRAFKTAFAGLRAFKTAFNNTACVHPHVSAYESC